MNCIWTNPFDGSRMLGDLLGREGFAVGRLHVSTLMKRMGIEAIYRRPNSSKPAPGHKVYPYLLRGLAVTRPSQVWAIDITYSPMARGFVYLAAVVDRFSRRVLAWRLWISMDVGFCIEAVEEAMSRRGAPEILNSEQGKPINEHGLHRAAARQWDCISTDGRGAWRDNVFVERLWRSIKYEKVYLGAYDTVSGARTSITKYLAFYNGGRPHSSLDRMTPDEAYFNARMRSWQRITKAEIHLANTRRKFRQTEPPLIASAGAATHCPS